MEKVVLNYEPTTGNLFDGSGAIVGSWMGVKSIEKVADPVSVQDLIDLKAAGYDVEEISALRKKGLI